MNETSSSSRASRRVRPVRTPPDEVRAEESRLRDVVVRRARAFLSRSNVQSASKAAQEAAGALDAALRDLSRAVHAHGERDDWPLVDDDEVEPVRGPKKELTPAVVVCGLPSSCNRLIQRIFQKAGAEVSIAHGIENGRSPILYSIIHRAHSQGRRVVAVMPVRDLYAWKMSSAHGRPASHDLTPLPCSWEYMDRAYQKTIQALAATRTRVLFVGVEALVQHPKTMAREMLSWAGLDAKILHEIEPIYDPNAPYYSRPKRRKVRDGALAYASRQRAKRR